MARLGGGRRAPADSRFENPPLVLVTGCDVLVIAMHPSVMINPDRCTVALQAASRAFKVRLGVLPVHHGVAPSIDDMSRRPSRITLVCAVGVVVLNVAGAVVFLDIPNLVRRVEEYVVEPMRLRTRMARLEDYGRRRVRGGPCALKARRLKVEVTVRSARGVLSVRGDAGEAFVQMEFGGRTLCLSLIHI